MIKHFKVVLIQPPIQDFYETGIRLQPIGLCYIKAAIKKELPLVEIVIKDYHRGWGRRTIPIPKDLSHLRQFYEWPDQSPFSTFFHYYHFGADFETISTDIKKEAPDLVGISSLFSPYYREVLKTAESVKNALSVPIIVGGSHVSCSPMSILESPFVDFIIQGEGERAFVEFLKCFIAGENTDHVPNLGYKKNGQCLLNPLGTNYSINEIPIPDLSDFTPQHYEFNKKPMCFMITSRSCPHRCSFCSVHLTFGYQFERRSTQQVLAEIIQRYHEGYRVFDFEDDNLTFYMNEMKSLCKKLIETFPKQDIQLVAMNGISYLSLDEELLWLMKEAGFTHLNLALVTSDKTVRETTKRPHTIEKYLEVVQTAKQLGFEIVSYQILGLPNESLESMIQTLIFNSRLSVLLGSSMFYLTPNSPIAKGFPEMKEKDIFLSRLTAMAIETESFKRKDIYTLFITTRIINFIKSVSVLENEMPLEEVLSLGFSEMNHRARIGREILHRLFNERKLYAWTKTGMKLIKNFDDDLFFKVWDQLEFIQTQNDKKIWINPFTLNKQIYSSVNLAIYK